jgi:hypothetical protein
VTFGGLLTLEVDLALNTLIGKGWGAAHLQGAAIHGRSPTNELMDVHGVSGNTAPQDVRIYEAWIEQPIGKLTIRGGLIAADQELVLAEQSSTLLSATFGITSQFSTNLLGPVYPISALGASARLELGAVSARAAIYDGTNTNSHGIPSALGPARLLVGELGAGPFKLGGWHHSERGTGVYAIGNAKVEKYVGAFSRVGYSPDGPIGHYIDAGLRVTPGKRRPDDFASVGIAYATTDAGAQIIFEGMYEIQIRYLTIQPDVQLMLLRDRTVGIVSLRTTIVF